ncbi:hypothetical protein JG687_00013406 [Phytophthora cactorum]|uniref:protein-tyrosine-phosphatase n=1 Tax=Phytophthora cactorum TaxID=29920 RepID=A0A8T1TZC6_9STRA|nr:hypothetical protein PC120_g12619 [Phytophthora cactorum]KAG3060278.1 hypothetical protein PC121_g13562 [Phytophthora cactorum]KAG3180745.1 hypothetical protein PC128_g15455 [Phytophthora cactorum]KAG4052178.1 hypothetical protein PC123_g12638 [Phytophthora cactorum]KAG6951757.1 hypothetical protein JG687_00013406 [Phytophthora cactorum]
MADERLRQSHLTPLLSSQLQLSTSPCSPSTRQNTVQNSERPTKRVGNRPRRLPERRAEVPRSSRRRAIFESENTQHMADEPKITDYVAQNMAEDEQFQDRKRAAVRAADELELSPRSTLAQQKTHKKKSKRGVEVEAAIETKQPVLKRAVSSYSVMTLGSLSTAPDVPPRLLRYHASEQSISIKTASAPPQEPILPTVYSSKHPDLNVITPETVAKILRGEFMEQLAGFKLLDCRFPFEFGGGSLKGASSLCDPEEMEAQFFESATLEHCTRTALIFFCEFSANRAPKMLRHVRNVDRRLHADSYPELYYPELYLIDGGYKNCFDTLQHEICAPSAVYVTMEDERFVEECRREFATWRRRWKPHKTIANCTAKLERSPQLSRRGPHQVRSNVAAGVRSLFDDL